MGFADAKPVRQGAALPAPWKREERDRSRFVLGLLPRATHSLQSADRL